jgi:hypothetical protein
MTPEDNSDKINLIHPSRAGKTKEEHMDFGRAFTFQFDDQDWVKKILIAAIIPLIPLIGSLAVAGWGIEITRRVIRGEATPLADWNDFGGYLGKGFQFLIIVIVYVIPLIVLGICPTVLLTTPAYTSGNVDETTSVLAILATVCFGLIFFVYAIFLAFMLPAALGRLADTGELGSALRFREVFGLVKAAPMAYLMVILGGIVSSFIGSLGTIGCGVGMLATTAYAATVNAHLQGQAYLEATGKRDLQTGFIPPVS